MEELNYKINRKPKCVLDIDIEVPWNRMEDDYSKVYSDISREVSLPGFRKGKVPMDIIKERYENEARQELVKRLAPEIIGEVLDREEIKPVTTPKISEYNIEPGVPFKVNVKVEVYPEVQLKKYRKIKLDKKMYSVEDKDVKNTIDNLRERNAVLKVKEDAAGKGDYVVTEMKVFEAGKEIKLNSSSQSIIEIGGESPMPGFSENLKGLKKGDSKEFEYIFPEDFPREELRGKTAEFKIGVQEVKSKVLPEISELAESMGFESSKKLSEEIHENLRNQLKKTARNELEEQIVNYLLEKHDFEIPEGLVEENVERHKKQMTNYVLQQGGNPSVLDMEKIREKAEKEIKAGVLLSLIAEQEGIEVAEEDRKKEEDRIIEILGKQDREKARKYVDGNVLLTKKVFDFIVDNAKIKNVEVDSK